MIVLPHNSRHRSSRINISENTFICVNIKLLKEEDINARLPSNIYNSTLMSYSKVIQ